MATSNTDNILTPYMAALDEAVTAIRHGAEQIAALTDAQWNWSPNANTWSALQVLDHLNKSSAKLIPDFDSAIAKIVATGTAAIGDAPMRYGLFERMFIKVVSPGTKIRVNVPPMLEPAKNGLDPKSVLTEFLAMQDSLLRCVRAGTGFDLTRLKMQSPVAKAFKPCVGAYLEGTIRHEQYHWLQVEALMANPSFPRK